MTAFRPQYRDIWRVGVEQHGARNFAKLLAMGGVSTSFL